MSGKASKLWRAGVVTQGSFACVIVSMKGTAQLGSSNSVGRTFTKLSIPTTRVNIHVMQSGQK